MQALAAIGAIVVAIVLFYGALKLLQRFEESSPQQKRKSKNEKL